MSLLEEFRNDVAGLALLKDWIGADGVPVHQSTAENRAMICARGIGGKPCPKNVEKNWWDRIKSQIANVIKMQLEMKHHLNLHVEVEDELGMCGCCGCALPTNVWVPTEHIKAHTEPDKFKDAPIECWIQKELES